CPAGRSIATSAIAFTRLVRRASPSAALPNSCSAHALTSRSFWSISTVDQRGLTFVASGQAFRPGLPMNHRKAPNTAARWLQLINGAQFDLTALGKLNGIAP